MCTEHEQMEKYSDHTYASPNLFQIEDEEYSLDDIDYSSIFDTHGNWQQRHKRCIINVMDSYRISHEAYHKLRHAGKGHLPPLYQIRIKKNLMSKEIPYIKHPTVSSNEYFITHIEHFFLISF